GQIKRPAHETSSHLLRIELDPRGLADKREWIHLAATEIQMNTRPVGERVHEMKTGASGSPEPAQILHTTVPRHDPDETVFRRLPDPVRTTRFHALQVRGRWKHGKYHVLLRDREVVHQRAVRNLEPFLPDQLPVLVGDTVRNIT